MAMNEKLRALGFVPYEPRPRTIRMRMNPANFDAAFGRTRALRTEEQRAALRAATGRGKYKFSMSGHSRAQRNAAQAKHSGRGAYGRGRIFSSLLKLGKAAASSSMGKKVISAAKKRAIDEANKLTSRAISHIEGQGAYATNDILNGGGGMDGVPQFTMGDEVGVITISHSEYITDVYAPHTAASFQVNTWNLNPGLPATFPWLSQVACNYEEYELMQCVFTVKPNMTDFVSTNGQVGTIAAATQYNNNEQPFHSKLQINTYEGAVSAKLTEGLGCAVECDPKQNAGTTAKYIRAGPVLQGGQNSIGQDINLYDSGIFNLAIINTPPQFNDQSVGELWISYTVKLRKHKYYSGEGNAIERDTYVLGDKAGSTTFNAMVSNYALGQQNRIYTTLTPIAETLLITFPQTFSGCARIVFAAGANNGAYFTSVLGGSVSGINDIYAPDIQSGAATTAWRYQRGSAASLSGYQACIEIHVNVEVSTTAGSTNPVPNTVKIVANGGASTWISGTLDISQYNQVFNYPQSKEIVLESPSTGQLVTPY